jgi:hypothetical protein
LASGSKAVRSRKTIQQPIKYLRSRVSGLQYFLRYRTNQKQFVQRHPAIPP